MNARLISLVLALAALAAILAPIASAGYYKP